MPTEFDNAFLELQLKSDKDSMDDLAFVAEDLHNLLIASLWATMLHPALDDESIINARLILQEDLRRPKAADRFYPGFGPNLFVTRTGPFAPIEIENEFSRSFNPYDPLDAALQIGMDSWFRRTIFRANPELLKRLFSFAYLGMLEHRSPLLIELVVVFGTGLTIPAVLVYGLMKAVDRASREAAEAEIRRTEAELKREELKQQKLRSQILEELTKAVHDLGVRNQIEVPREVLIEAARIASPSVADLSQNPLIGQITVGLSAGGQK